MNEQRDAGGERFIAVHQFAVLFVGVAVITLSPEGSVSFILPFIVALSPGLFVLACRPAAHAVVDEKSHRRRVYVLSSRIGFACVLGIAAMWCIWIWLEGMHLLVAASY